MNEILISFSSVTLLYFFLDMSLYIKKIKALEKNRKITERLLEILSFEIERPRSLIYNYAHLLKAKHHNNPRLSNYLQKISRSAEAIKTITTRVYELEKLQSKKDFFQCKNFDLTEAIESTLSLYRTKAQEKNIEITFNKSNDNLSIFAEKEVLSLQVLPNILSNAIKFSQPQTTIEILAQEDRLLIKDHGIGMPKEILSDLFSLDKVTSRLGTSGEKGTGFGMPLVKELLGRMKADIKVESRDIAISPKFHGTQVEISFSPNEFH